MQILEQSAGAVMDAYLQNVMVQNESQIRESELILSASIQLYQYLDEHENVSQGLSGGGKVVKGTIGIISGAALLLAPVPTAAEDLVGVRKITFGVYNVCYGMAEIVGAVVG